MSGKDPIDQQISYASWADMKWCEERARSDPSGLEAQLFSYFLREGSRALGKGRSGLRGCASRDRYCTRQRTELKNMASGLRVAMPRAA